MNAEPTVLAGQLARLGWSLPTILRLERELEANQIALDRDVERRRREAGMVRFYAYLITRMGEAGAWKKINRRQWGSKK